MMMSPLKKISKLENLKSEILILCLLTLELNGFLLETSSNVSLIFNMLNKIS